jgi:putative transposase
MAFAYTISDQGAVHFVTFTVHLWADVFTRQNYIDILLEGLVYCQKNKGLEIYAWVVMSNHCHLILRAANENSSDIIRDLKKYTAKQIFKAIEENPHESRKEWLLKVLSINGRIWFWEEGYHGEEVFSKEFFFTKAEYIHYNPVKAGIVAKPEDYLNSSAARFYGVENRGIELSYFG